MIIADIFANEPNPNQVVEDALNKHFDGRAKVTRITTGRDYSYVYYVLGKNLAEHMSIAEAGDDLDTWASDTFNIHAVTFGT